MAQDFAYQNSPATLGLYLEIHRGANYPPIDLTTVTSVTAAVTLPRASTPTSWSFQIVAAETTAARLVIFHAFASGNTALTGNVKIVVTPITPAGALSPALFILPVRGPALS